MSTGLVTIVHGRHGHLLRQWEGLASSTTQPDVAVVVAMDDPGVAALCLSSGSLRPEIVEIPKARLGLPLAAARNAGARRAISSGADTVIFLDVDCIPSAAMIAAYRATANEERWSDSVLCGPVSYLPPATEAGYELQSLNLMAKPHAARPAPDEGEVTPGGAVTAGHFEKKPQ